MQNIKFLEDNVRGNLSELKYDFLDVTPKAWFMKEIIDKIFWKRQWENKPQTGRKYLQKTSDKGLLSKIYWELLKLISWKQNSKMVLVKLVNG